MSKVPVSTHINLISLKVVDLVESEQFYDLLHEHLGLVKKETNNNDLVYWGTFGIQLSQLDKIFQNPEAKHRIGIVKVSIRVGTRELVDQLAFKMNENNFQIMSKPQAYVYAPGYYSVCLLDPDHNQLEIVYLD